MQKEVQLAIASMLQAYNIFFPAARSARQKGRWQQAAIKVRLLLLRRKMLKNWRGFVDRTRTGSSQQSRIQQQCV